MFFSIRTGKKKAFLSTFLFLSAPWPGHTEYRYPTRRYKNGKVWKSRTPYSEHVEIIKYK